MKSDGCTNTDTISGTYCRECDDEYDKKVDKCPKHGIATCSIPSDFYERHLECVEVFYLLYDDEIPTSGKSITKNLDDVVRSVLNEYKRAISMFAPMHSANEGYAVLKKDEFWDAIKRNDVDNTNKKQFKLLRWGLGSW